MVSSEPDWAWLPEGILDGILDFIVSFYDYARFGAVCKNWYSIAQHQRRHLMELWSVQLPLLMFPSVDGREDEQSLYDITTNKTYDFKLHYNKRCVGYSHGWLATLGKDMLITLRNPFLNRIITLPPIFTFTDDDHWRMDYEYWIYKVVLSHNPYLYPDKYEVVAIYEGCLAILKPGSQSWAYLERKYMMFACYIDIIYYEDMILAINHNGLMSINGNGSRPQGKIIAYNNPYGAGDRCVHYLVKSSGGDLLSIHRHIRWSDGVTKNFKIYMTCRDSLTNKANKPYSREIKSLGDDALFVGDSHSLCVKASNFPGCKPNAIYFAPHFGYEFSGDIDKGLHDMGVYNLEDESITPHYPFDQSRRYFPPPVWVVPTLGDNARVQLTYSS